MPVLFESGYLALSFCNLLRCLMKIFIAWVIYTFTLDFCNIRGLIFNLWNTISPETYIQGVLGVRRTSSARERNT